MDSFKIVDFTDDEIILKTDDLYRVIFHGSEDDHEPIEMLTASEAITYASTYNTCHGRRGKEWAEPISYRDSYQRLQMEDEDERVEERVRKITEASKSKRKRA